MFEDIFQNPALLYVVGLLVLIMALLLWSIRASQKRQL